MYELYFEVCCIDSWIHIYIVFVYTLTCTSELKCTNTCILTYNVYFPTMSVRAKHLQKCVCTGQQSLLELDTCEDHTARHKPFLVVPRSLPHPVVGWLRFPCLKRSVLLWKIMKANPVVKRYRKWMSCKSAQSLYEKGMPLFHQLADFRERTLADFL